LKKDLIKGEELATNLVTKETIFYQTIDMINTVHTPGHQKMRFLYSQ
jgi:hypothetical protein